METRRPIINESAVSEERTKFINGQAMHLRSMLRELNLSSIRVSSTPEQRNSGFFRVRRTLVATSMDEFSLVLAASGNNLEKESMVSVLIATPKDQNTSGIVTKNRGKSLYTDSFWVCENGAFKYIFPSEPIVADGIISAYDNLREDASWSQENKALTDLNDDKQRTKEILSRAGLNVPKGVLIGSSDEIDTKLAELQSIIPNRKWYVIKGLKGSSGKNVVILKKDSEYLTDLLVNEVHFGEHPMIAEERITPPPLSSLVGGLSRSLSNPNIDYNFRVITTLDSKHPRVVDAEIRFRKQDEHPTAVNITFEDDPASAMRLDRFRDEKLKQKIYKVAELATKAVCQHAKYSPGKSFGLAGVDIMIDTDRTIYVIEVNTGGVGGFGTLARIDKKPSSSIANILIPAWLPRLERNFGKREVNPRGKFERIKLNLSDRYTILNSLIEGGNYKDAEEYALTKLSGLLDSHAIGEIFCYIAAKTGSFDTAERYVRGALRAETDNVRLRSLFREIQAERKTN